MSQKRRLTGYYDDTEELIMSRMNQWEKRTHQRPKTRKKIKTNQKNSKYVSPKTHRTLGALYEAPITLPSQVYTESKSPTLKKHQAKDPTHSNSKRHHRRHLDKDGGDHVVKFGGKEAKEPNKNEICVPKSLGGYDPTPPCGDDYRHRGLERGSGYVIPIKSRCASPTTQDPRAGLALPNIVYRDPFSSLYASMDKVCPGQPRPSSAPRNSTSLERKLFELSRAGRVPCLQKYLTTQPKLNINVKNFAGESALRIAVMMGHEALVAFLCTLKGIDLGDILFYAIRYKQQTIVKYFCETHGLDRVFHCITDSDFPPYVTPLSLAAEVGSYEIIEYFLNVRGHDTITEPHDIRCRCKLVCEQLKSGDQLLVAMRALHTYAALSQPCYYIHVTDDPISRSFRLYNRLMDISEFYVALKPFFINYAERAQQFAVDLIAECRSSDEVKTILYKETSEPKFWDTIQKNELPCLLMALDFHQKCFVAHPHVQIVLKEMWIGDFYSWNVWTSIQKSTQFFKRLFLTPYIYYLLLIRPKSEEAHHYTLPINKMISGLSCYVLFLCLIFYCNISTGPKIRRPYTYKDVELYVLIFVVGYTFNLIRYALLAHPKRFIRYAWNIYDISTLVAFWLAIAFWISSQIHYWLMTNKMRNLERKYWGGMDPVLMAEGFFVIGSVLAYLKLLFFFQINFHIGPMQVALDSMVKEFAKYSIFWLIILVSFTVALGKYYAYYTGMQYEDADTGTMLKQENSFVSYRSTFKTLFWGIFDMSSFSTADVIISNHDNNKLYINRHDFTEFVGYFAFGSYTIIMGIIVMNMIIATMSAAFARVLADVDNEWAMSKTHVYLHYICQSVLAPPFNLLPHSYSLVSAFKDRPLHKCAPPPLKKLTHDELTRKLILRYFRTKADERRAEPVCLYPGKYDRTKRPQMM